MEFTKKNIREFQKVASSFHDWHCSYFNYDVIEKKLLIETEYIGKEDKRIIAFKNVEYFEMVGGESWGYCPEFPRIIEWVLMSDDTLLCKLKDYFIKQNIYNKHMQLPKFEDLFQTKILLHSGNAIDILCEYIEIREENSI